MRWLFASMIFAVSQAPVWAQTGAQAGTAERDRFLAALGQQVDDATLNLWRALAEPVLEEVMTIAYGYGAKAAVTPAAIATYSAHKRAGARARAIEDLLRVDLNGDMTIDRDEVDAVDLSLSGRQRGLAWTRLRRADTDTDGTVNLDELRAYADLRALRHYSATAAQRTRDLMMLDIDGDGQLTVPEAELALHWIAGAPAEAFVLAADLEEDA